MSKVNKLVERAAFTLVELLVVIAIIGTLVGLLLPAVQTARESARRSSCTNNLKQIGLGLHQHHDAFKRLPPSAIKSGYDPLNRNRAGWGWTLAILPYLEQQPLYDQIYTISAPTNMNAAKKDLARVPINTLLCPSCNVVPAATEAAYGSHGLGKSNYLGNGGPICAYSGSADQQKTVSLGALTRVAGLEFKHVTDGLTKTFMVGEAGGTPATAADAAKVPGLWTGVSGADQTQQEVVRWTYQKLNSGQLAPGNPRAFGSFHPGGANFVMCDGAVRFIDDFIEFNNTGISSALSAGTDATNTSYITAAHSASRGVFQKLSARADGNAIEGP
jgi:prepilin-type N-terminal cleavage/methylation domain-containing protein/prepilin-type processing-associated H-X9-DG protein